MTEKMSEKTRALDELCRGFREKKKAIAFVNKLKYDALIDKRACGQVDNPFKAVPGMEEDFKEADNTIRYCDYILKEFEKKPKRERRKKEVAHVAYGVANRFLIIVGGAGITTATVLGIIVFTLLLKISPLSFFISAAMVAIVTELWSQRRSRKKL